MACKNGWHTIHGFRVFVEDGFVLRGLSNDGQRPVYIYEATRDGFSKVERLSVSAFRSRCARGTLYMF